VQKIKEQLISVETILIKNYASWTTLSPSKEDSVKVSPNQASAGRTKRK